MFHAGFDEYEFISLGEEAEDVCRVCDDLDGQRFKITDAVVGVNCPPMHPFCRCKVTTPQQTEEDIQREIDERIDSWNIPEGMSLDEFIDRVNNGELEETIAEQNSAEESVEENDDIFSEREVKGIFNDESDNPPLDISKNSDIIDNSVERPADEPDYMKQFNVFDPSTRTIEEKAAQVNPHFHDTPKLPEYSDNCIRTATAYELIEQGYDVEALPSNTSDEIGYDFHKLWNVDRQNGYVETNKNDFISDVVKSLKTWGESSRAFVLVDWSSGGSHAFNVKRFGNSAVFIESQKGRIIDIYSCLKKVSDKDNSIALIRSDNMKMSELVVFAVKNRSE